MTKIPIYIDVIDTNRQIQQNIMREITAELNKRLPKAISNMSVRLRTATFQFLQHNETYQSLVNGDLAGHFGIPIANRQNRIDAIIKSVSDNMEIEYRPIKYFAGKMTPAIRIGVLLKDLSEVLNLTEGNVLTEKGQTLPWLDWLLLAGNRIIIREYDVELQVGAGRSGLGIMDQGDTYIWRVPPEFSGTLTDNWLTRALLENKRSYLNIIENIIKTELQGI
jgi:hypothetical protein